jgi:predicted HD phosphohydrolase
MTMTQTNTFFTKPFLKTLLWKQNKHHRHGVFMHTMRVVYYALMNGDFKMLPAAFLHDIGKPLVAYQKEEDIALNEYSFTDHEEKSYEVIKGWPFVSVYTKLLVRYHYLIRDIDKHKFRNPKRYNEKKAIWEKLSPEMQADLVTFLKYDDLGKGIKHKKIEGVK